MTTPAPEKVYEIIRARILHEDDLVNQRLMWMITFNGLLFTAYGFSLSAEASSLTALAPSAASSAPLAGPQKDAYDSLHESIGVVRMAMAWVGILSSLAAYFGVAAANRAIRNDQLYFRQYLGNPASGAGLIGFPPIIGKWSTNILGMASSMAVPFLAAGAWMWTLQKFPNWMLIVIGLALGVTGAMLVWVLHGAASFRADAET